LLENIFIAIALMAFFFMTIWTLTPPPQPPSANVIKITNPEPNESYIIKTVSADAGTQKE
jgi:hypothetical protein